MSFYTAEESVFPDWKIRDLDDKIQSMNGTDGTASSIGTVTDRGEVNLEDGSSETMTRIDEAESLEGGARREEEVLHQLLQWDELCHPTRPTIQRCHSEPALLPLPNPRRPFNHHGRQKSQNRHHRFVHQTGRIWGQRDMFMKPPTKTNQDLAKVRAKKVRLLSQLRVSNTDPENVPHQSSYQTSSGFIQETSPPAPAPTVEDSEELDTGMPAPPTSSIQPGRYASTDETKKPPSRPFFVSLTKASPIPLTKLSPTKAHLMKSAAATPLSSVIHAGSDVAPAAMAAVMSSNTVPTSPRSCPPRSSRDAKDLETEYGSNSEDSTTIVFPSPKSVAEESLKTLAAKRGIQSAQAPQHQSGPSQQPTDDDVPESAYVPQPPHDVLPPTPPMTAAALRRQMLSTELSQSVYHSLLSERLIKHSHNKGMEQAARTDGPQQSAVDGPLPPSIPRLVQLHPKGSILPNQQEGGGDFVIEQERDEMRKYSMASNHSWAKGW